MSIEVKWFADHYTPSCEKAHVGEWNLRLWGKGPVSFRMHRRREVFEGQAESAKAAKAAMLRMCEVLDEVETASEKKEGAKMGVEGAKTAVVVTKQVKISCRGTNDSDSGLVVHDEGVADRVQFTVLREGVVRGAIYIYRADLAEFLHAASKLVPSTNGQ